MATYTRNNVSAALTSTTAWAEGIIPGSSDTAKWDAASLGGTQTGALTVQGLQLVSATSTPVQTNNLVTLGSGGFTITSGNAKRWIFQGGVTVTADQTWTLGANITSADVEIYGATRLSGSNTITVNSPTYRATIYTDGATDFPFTGILKIQNNITVSSATASTGKGWGTNTTIWITGTGCQFKPGTSIGTAPVPMPSAIRLESSMEVLNSSSVVHIFSGNFELYGTGSRTVTASYPFTISGAIFGTANLYKSGSGKLTVSSTYNGYGGNVVVGQGTLTLTGDGAFFQAANIEVQGGTTLELNSAGTYSINSNILGSGAITKFNTNDIQFYGAASTHSGTLTISGGSVTIAVNNALGSSGSISVGGTYALIVNASNAKPVTLATNAILKGSGTQTGNITLTGMATIGEGFSANILTVNSPTITGSSQQLNFEGNVLCSSAISTNLVYIGTNTGGDITLSGTSSFTTTIRVYNEGYIRAAILAAAGSPSSLGSQASATTCISFDTAAPAGFTGFGYTGTTAATFNRKITLNATTSNSIYCFGSHSTGALTIGSNTWAATVGISGHQAYLQGESTANNRWVYPMSDTALFRSVFKTGTGTWVLPNAWATTNSYDVAVQQGTLVAESPDGSARFGAGATVTRLNTANRGRIKTLTGTSQRGRHTYGYLLFNHGDIWIGGS